MKLASTTDVVLDCSSDDRLDFSLSELAFSLTGFLEAIAAGSLESIAMGSLEEVSVGGVAGEWCPRFEENAGLGVDLQSLEDGMVRGRRNLLKRY